MVAGRLASRYKVAGIVSGRLLGLAVRISDLVQPVCRVRWL